MSLDRRFIMAGGLAAAAGPAFGADPQLKGRGKGRAPAPEPVRLFTEGPLARNQVAIEFEVPNPPLVWPKNVRLNGIGRERTSIEAFRGKTLLVSLWAEWCTPCLIEMPGFAELDRRLRSDTFQILPILTSSLSFTRPEDAVPVMEKLNAKSLPLLMDGSDRLVSALARSPTARSGALPCNLIIDPAGNIRGRQIGSGRVEVEGQKYSVYATTIALQFATALANGAVA